MRPDPTQLMNGLDPCPTVGWPDTHDTKDGCACVCYCGSCDEHIAHMSVQFIWRTMNVHGERSAATTYNIASMARSFDYCRTTPPFRRCPICCPLSLQTCAGNSLARKAVQLRFDRRSTPIRLQFNRATTILRYGLTDMGVLHCGLNK